MRRHHDSLPLDVRETEEGRRDLVATTTQERGFPGMLSSSCCMPVIVLLALFVVIADLVQPGQIGPVSGWFSPAPRADRRPADGGGDTNVSDDAAVESPGDNGLQSASSEKSSCLSMHQFSLYHKESKHKPSSYLQQKLQKYEALHKRCAPYTKLYNKSVAQILNQNAFAETMECKYVIWEADGGLGNRMLSLTSTFLYALLTNRVLLLSKASDMGDLFCEPFQVGTWILPIEFPYLNQFFYNKYGHMLKTKEIDRNQDEPLVKTPSSYVYAHLLSYYDKDDQLFFCDHDQSILQKFPWMLMQSENYFTPGLFLIPKFEQELNFLFPEKDTIFHHLAHYLFHPSNAVWELITRYYQAYLNKNDESIGVQIRIFNQGNEQFKELLYDKVLACMLKEGLVPTVDQKKQFALGKNGRSKALLLTSLSTYFFEKIKSMYSEHPTVNGENVSVYQPSHEGEQKTHIHAHNMKALAEIYLLSLTNALITTSGSTFGYIAQGISGMTPLILSNNNNNTNPTYPCHKGISIEPCFHSPPNYDCKGRRIMDIERLVPHFRHCEDMRNGIKLVG